MKKPVSLLIILAVMLCGAAASAEGAIDVNTSDWAYYTFEGSAVGMKLPADFEPVTDAPEPGIFYNCGNDDIVLQVTPVDGDFADREALAAYYNAQDYVVKAEPVEINGVELVYVEGGDDDVTAYAAISPEGTVYQFAFFPLSDGENDGRGVEVARAVAMTICSSESVPFEGRTIAPMPEEIDLNEGTYPASFDRANLKDGVLNGVHLYTEDCYDIVDISRLAVGDFIVIDGERIGVESLDYGDDLRINGGIDEGGYNLRAYDEDNCWRVALEDDFPTYTDHGEATLALADDAAFTDAWDIEKEPVSVQGAEEIAGAIAESEYDWFDRYNTTVRIEDGRIVEIERRYVP